MAITMSKNILKNKEKFSLIMLIMASVAAVVFQVDIILILLVCGIIGCVYPYKTKKGSGGKR